MRLWQERYQADIERPNLQVELAESPGIGLLSLLEGTKPVILVDAVHSNAKSGTIHLLSEDQLESFSNGSGSAHLDLALEAVLWGAFGTTGQRCTATSRLILHKSNHDKFLKMLTDRVKKLKLGYGNDKGVDVGPCVSESQRETVNDYVNIRNE